MNVLGISPLDKDATASLVVDGKVVFAAAEERFSRKKFHSGFPYASVEAALKWAGLGPKTCTRSPTRSTTRRARRG